MKKNILLLLLIPMACAFSQTNINEKLVVKTGANFGFYSGSIANWDGKISYSISLGYEIPFSDKLAFQPEIGYNRLAATSERTEFWPYYGNTYVTVEEKLKLSIITIPLMFKYKINNSFTALLGPQVNYVSFAERERPGKYVTEKPNAYIKEFDFGPKLGVEYNFTSNFFIEANYFYGLLTLDKNPDTFNSNSTNTNIGSLSISSINLGYKF